MAEDEETVEETTVTHAVDQRAKGLRLWLSLALMAGGAVLVALGILLDLPTGVRTALILGGIALAATFAFVAYGARRVGGGGNVPGADLPQNESVRTTVRTRGLPKHGNMPPKQGHIPGRAPDTGQTETGESGSAA